MQGCDSYQFQLKITFNTLAKRREKNGKSDEYEKKEYKKIKLKSFAINKTSFIVVKALKLQFLLY